MFKLFAVTLPGLEPYTRKEIMGLEIQSMQPGEFSGEPVEESGGIAFDASMADLYRVNLHLRTANRVLARLGEFPCTAFSELRRKAAKLPWESYLRKGSSVALRVTCHKSRLHHSDAVAERVLGAIGDRLGAPSPLVKFNEAEETLPQLIVVRVVRDVCTISLDTSGPLLHRRGYRLATGKAPLRETLAAGLLMAAGWDKTSPLLDAFCGSGTIAIEAALMARGIPPGKDRKFAFMEWPCFDAGKWKSVLASARRQEKAPCPIILASDRDEGVIEMAKANAERAGVSQNIQFECKPFSAVEPGQQTGWIVTNPPYGIRTESSRDLRNLYAGFGNLLHEQFSGWKVGILSNSEPLIGQMKMRFETRISLFNGGLPVQFFIGMVR
jgi:putative N6-adenine-specific DNA methylase